MDIVFYPYQSAIRETDWFSFVTQKNKNRGEMYPFHPCERNPFFDIEKAPILEKLICTW